MTVTEHEQQAARIHAYYRFQAKIYDLTRWSFLFGRRQLLRRLPYAPTDSFSLLEVGCGTGYNLLQATRLYPEAQLSGLDVSPDMLRIARKRVSGRSGVKLFQLPYQQNYYSWTGKMEVILCAYALSMINPQWEEWIEQAYEDLRPGGYLAVVDFYDSNWSFFKQHMGNHHVRMDGHLLPVLRMHFEPVYEAIKPAYGGLWHYFQWIGQKA